MRHVIGGLILGSVFISSQSLSGPLEAIGRFFGSPIGSFVEAASAPMLISAENTGHRLIADLDQTVGKNITRTTDAIDVISKNRLAEVDASMEARIAQIGETGNSLVQNTMGSLDDISRNRLQQALRGTSAIIKQLDKNSQARLVQVDESMRARIDQVRSVVDQSLREVDQIMADRIEQVDEVAERRIGNVDVIASKQSLNIESSLLKIGALIGLLVLIVYMLRKTYEDLTLRWKEYENARGALRPLKTMLRAMLPLAVRTAVGIAGAAFLFFMSQWMPIGTKKEIDRLSALHAGALSSAESGMDLSRMRYHAAQLLILTPANDPIYRAKILKAEAIRAAFSQPALSSDGSGVRRFLVMLEAAEDAYRASLSAEEAKSAAIDPDLATLRCFVQWRTAMTKLAEQEAVQHCLRALQEPQHPDRRQHLRGLALSYVRNFLHDPPYLDAGQLGELRRVAEQPDEPIRSLQHVIEYDRLVRELRKESTEAYLAMIEADAMCAFAKKGSKELADARIARMKAADRVIKAWQNFDANLRANVHLSGTNAPIAAFMLDDVPLVHALWFKANPEADRLPKRIAAEPKLTDRAQMLPVRVRWAKELGGALRPETQMLMSFEESERYLELEGRGIAFEQAAREYFLAKLAALDAVKLLLLRELALTLAAEIGIERDLREKSFGSEPPKNPELLERLRQAELRRHIRFL